MPRGAAFAFQLWRDNHKEESQAVNSGRVESKQEPKPLTQLPQVS